MSELVSQGLTLTVFGMGTVFVFLTILVFATSIMSTLVNKFAPEAAPAIAKAPQPQTQSVDPQLVKVLSAAVKQYRANQK